MFSHVRFRGSRKQPALATVLTVNVRRILLALGRRVWMVVMRWLWMLWRWPVGSRGRWRRRGESAAASVSTAER
jgi:hypothetical protein